MNGDRSQALIDALAAFENRPVSVRVVSAGDELIAVFTGTLATRSDEKAPSLFWPVHGSTEPAEQERPGIWVHPAILERVRVHTGSVVLEFVQGGVTVNVRRLPVAAS